MTDGHTFAELKCVFERLIFGECFATKLRLFLFRLPASLAERSINGGGGSLLAESFFLALRLSFRSSFSGKKILYLLGYRNIVNTMELEQQPNASVLD